MTLFLARLPALLLALSMMLASAGGALAAAKKEPGKNAFDWASRSWSRADYTVARLKPFAEKGYARAQTILGFVHLYGHGTPRSVARAAEWFAKAAAQDYPPAQHALARLYLGAKEAGRRERDEGVRLMLAAARANHPLAQVELGLMHERGQYVKRDSQRSVAWFQRAAEQDFAPGQFLLALALAKGHGTKKDDKAAHDWGKRAAESGYSEAQLWLGYRYLKGVGVKRSRVEGLAWLFIAAAGGEARAKQVLARYRARVFEDVWERAKAKAAAFKPPAKPKPIF
ncbi:MAG TPA: tetratricopeptide repeat protein [Alphaproteobacteria bacterium]|nr:tetratricopeptide repeat protein [Alphaproteobacteria bacterium]